MTLRETTGCEAVSTSIETRAPSKAKGVKALMAGMAGDRRLTGARPLYFVF